MTCYLFKQVSSGDGSHLISSLKISRVIQGQGHIGSGSRPCMVAKEKRRYLHLCIKEFIVNIREIICWL